MSKPSILKINKISIVNALTGEKILELEESYTDSVNIIIDVTNKCFDNLKTQKSIHYNENIELESQD